MNSGAARLAEAIRADEGLARLMSQVFSAENRSALMAGRAQLLRFEDQLRSFADQLRAAWAPLLEGLRPLARSLAAVLSVPRAGDVPVHLGDRRSALGQRLGRAPSRAWVSAARDRQSGRSEHAGDGAPGGGSAAAA